MLYGHAIDPADGSVIDEVLAVVMRAPRSYTCEDIVEISCHGGFVPIRKMLQMLIDEGARLAEPGEFTKRAFLNGRLNLSQAEAVADIINAKTEKGLRIAEEQLRGSISDRLSELREELVDIASHVEAYIDFPEEDISTATRKEIFDRLSVVSGSIRKLSSTFDEARFFKDGLSAAIIGRPNVGKSSLLNRLIKKDRAIVTELPGTTRDIIEEYLNINGLPVRIIDTAGIRDSDEVIEQEGIRRSRQAVEQADFVLALLDSSRPLESEDMELVDMLKGKNHMIVLSKSDLPRMLDTKALTDDSDSTISISSATGEGIDRLKNAIFDLNINKSHNEDEGVIITNMRHKSALDRADLALRKTADLLMRDEPVELFSIEMRTALDSMGEITGTVTTDEVLNRIFSSFCIGK
jgi:tRNA modification GTPase